MSKMPKMNLWIDAFNSDTSFLTDEELGIYFRLIFFAWGREGYLPKDLEFIVNLTRNKNSEAINKIIKLYWVEDDIGYYQKRLKEEYERAVRVTESAKKSAEFRWDKNVDHSQSERNASISKSTSISISKKSINKNFQIFWDMICYKISKGQARRNFEKLSKEWQEMSDELARMYNKYYLNLGDKKYAKHPSTWLSAEGWEDETPKEESKEDADAYKLKSHAEMYAKGHRLPTWSRGYMEQLEELANKLE